MFLTYYNNSIKISIKKDEPIYKDVVGTIASSLSVTYKEKKFIKYSGRMHVDYVRRVERLYVEEEAKGFSHYSFSPNYYEMLPKSFRDFIETQNLSDLRYNLDTQKLKLDKEYIKKILQPYSGFDLRDDQILAVQKALYCKKGILQLATGAGKTAIMAAIIKELQLVDPEIKVLVLEPTRALCDSIRHTLEDYQIFGDNIYIDCPKTVDNLLKINRINDISLVLWDECQHCSCATYRDISKRITNAIYSIGLSALAISPKHMYSKNIKDYDLSELVILGAAGKVIMYLPTSYYIDNHILSKPVLIRATFKTNKLKGSNDWHKLNKEIIQSDERNSLVSDYIEFFTNYNRRVLILVATKQQGFDIADKILARDLESKLLVAYGNHTQFVYENKKLVPYKGDGLKEYDLGNYSILIGTNHLDEGIDLKNLDVVILACGGKKDRRLIQRIGRGLRKTKTGKYAYIVDFTDEGNGILASHSRSRLSIYKKYIGIEDNLIYQINDISQMPEIFAHLEKGV